MEETQEHRITDERVNQFNVRFPRLAQKYQVIHRDNCHHWDYLFVLWHRKLVNQFWEEIDIPRFFFIPYDNADVELYKRLVHSVNAQGRGYRDIRKMRRWSSADAESLVAHLVQAFACETFDLAFGENAQNRSRNGLYNISFSSQLEEAHDIVHGATGTGMQRVGTAGGDATFFIHHTFVDLCFEFWKTRSDKQLPISRDHFESSEQLKESFASFEEIDRLWNQTFYSAADYWRIGTMLEGQEPSTLVLRFGKITHTREFRSVIILYPQRTGAREVEVEIGRFAVITGTIENCESCRQRLTHTSSFALTPTNPDVRLERMRWIIDGQRFSTLIRARQKLAEIGMTELELVSFSFESTNTPQNT